MIARARVMMRKPLVLAVGIALRASTACAQDVPGVEVCTMEKSMVRRTSCLQSDVDFLQKLISSIDLSNAIGLETCQHLLPSTVDHQTLAKSGQLPLPFLRGVGLPDNLIEYFPSLINRPIQYFSCFISYSAKDQEFADRLHADLQNTGVRCWFALHDMRIGGKILDEIDSTIRLKDKLLLILSTHSIGSDWVEVEATAAFEEERRRGQTVLFPIRLDDAVMETSEAWAAELRAQRNIGDFRQWKNHSAYKIGFDRVIRDLAPKAKRTNGG
jgi:hypothetical protein